MAKMIFDKDRIISEVLENNKDKNIDIDSYTKGLSDMYNKLMRDYILVPTLQFVAKNFTEKQIEKKLKNIPQDDSKTLKEILQKLS